MKIISIPDFPCDALSDNNIPGLIDYDMSTVKSFTKYYILNARTTLKLYKLWNHSSEVGLFTCQEIEYYLDNI